MKNTLINSLFFYLVVQVALVQQLPVNEEDRQICIQLGILLVHRVVFSWWDPTFELAKRLVVGISVN
jgi:hypothetical protein